LAPAGNGSKVGFHRRSYSPPARDTQRAQREERGERRREKEREKEGERGKWKKEETAGRNSNSRSWGVQQRTKRRACSLFGNVSGNMAVKRAGAMVELALLRRKVFGDVLYPPSGR
jgi:hypothetical protein